MQDVAPDIIDKAPDTTIQDGVGVLARRFPRGHRLSWHRHGVGQVLHAVQGTMLVETMAGRWVVPVGRALWLPPRAPHALTMAGDVEMRTAYVAEARLRGCALAAGAVKVIEASPLLRACLLGLFDDESAPQRRAALITLLIDEVQRAPDASTFLPMPADPRVLAVARAVLSAPGQDSAAEDLAQAAGLSMRSLSRAFPLETGLTFKSWRQRARIMTAVTMLSGGSAPKQVAAALGFSSQAAFAAAFRAVMRRSPTQAE